MLRSIVALACALVVATPLYAQAPVPDGVDLLLRQLETLLNAGDRATFPSVFAGTMTPRQIEAFASDLFTPGAVRILVRERDRAQLEGVPDGEGHRLVVEFFVEMPGRARILTAGVDVRRPPGGAAASWRIVGAEGLTSVEGIYRLRLNTTTQYAARNLDIASEDLTLTLRDGSVFLIDSDDGVTGVVLLGRGEMRFAPPSAPERGQLRLFAGSETLVTQFDNAFIRLSPSDYAKVVTTSALTSVPVDARMARRAQDVFARESPKSYGVDLQDLSRDTWHLLPPATDFLAEVQTRRYGTLTFSRASAQAEDVSLMHRQRRLTISLYASAAKLAARGRFYSDDVLREYDVLDYNIEAAVSPERQFVQGRARLAIRVRTSVSTLMLRLADPLAVTGVTSVEFGRLLHLRLRNQNTVLINLPRTLVPDSDVTLVITYAGRVEPQEVETETMQVGEGQQPPPETPFLAPEPNFLLSNRSYWYPQNPVPDYATATLRITVPEGYTCVASGQWMPSSNAITLRELLSIPDGKVFTFRAAQPLRYLAFVVSRFVRVAERTIALNGPQSDGAEDDRLAIAVEANPRQQARGRAIVRPMEDILRFYASLMHDAPYTATTLALIESDLPGGHSPGYFAVLNQQVPTAAPVQYRGDPAAFDGFPEFFLAHELAHQWWGQAIGWKNYHEQWLSEGFAQYFAALYAQKARGDRVFADMLKQFRRWSLSDSDQGPIYLGYRLGHVKSDLRVFRAVVYNKGAGVLHMLRRLVGDEAFFNGLRRFYEDRKYQKAGTDDLQRALEAESGRSLERFFERWIYDTELPRIDYRTAVHDREVTVSFDQLTERVFELPVTVTLVYTDGRTKDVIVPIADKHVEQTIAAEAAVRQVQVNRDSAALAEFEERDR